MSNVPKLRFSEFNGEWEEKKLGEITTKKSSNISANTLGENTGVYKIYGAAGYLKDIDFFTEDEEYISIVKDGAGVGRALLCDKNSSALGTLDIVKNKENVNLHFVYLLLTRIYFEKYIVGSTIPHIYYKDYSSEKVNIPCFKEQQKIASFLTAIDKKIDLLTKKESLLQEYKKGVMQKIFNQEIRFKDDDGSEFGEWEKKKFGDFMELPQNFKPDKAEKDKLLTIKLHQKGISKNKKTDTLSMGATYYIRSKGQFIYGKQNLFNGAFGIIPDKFDKFLSSSDVPALNFKLSHVNPNYFLLFLGRESYYRGLEKFASGTGSKRIHEKILLGFKASFPSLKEQTKIANFLSAIDKKIEVTKKQLEKTKTYKKALLQQMFI